MNRSNDIEAEWTQVVPRLAGSGFLPAPYRVPDGYFQAFFDRLMMQIRTEESGGLNAVPSTGAVYGFGEELSPGEEIAAISPLLAGLSRKTPYQVPENYFAQFRVSDDKAAGIVADFETALPLDLGIGNSETNIPAVAAIGSTVQPAPVIRMNHGRGWMRIAVAAAITAVIFTSAFFYFRPSRNNVAHELTKVSDQDMANYMASEDVPVETINESNPAQAVSGATQAFNDNEISDLMSNVSDTELVAYASSDGPDSNLN